ncbi:ATP12 family chaperone protein [Paracoccus sp. SCSIO 75233]|uniref:ATP12 family chaperone protein n=1 Tax=Paracoccus sp. SCSIO 75233 TaxID=3017782 RepID=UPI0022F017B7|nr:ATP12 family protein [Paracoccus sp. SCSIO 75233]WBU51841.1 ATPase [Paracoccus sp. SCSIO 75233]
MSEWKARRFWKTAEVEPVAAGWRVTLDGRPVMTPGKLDLVIPNEALARAIAAEWDAQDDVIRPDLMPLTRAANSAVEKVEPQFSAVADMLGDYGGTDLLCYRATEPADLQARQAEAWDPLLDWASAEYDASLVVTQGVMPVGQNPDAVLALRARLDGLSHYELTALHDLVTLSGSLILGLAVLEGRLSADEAFDLSRIDERYQAEIWGDDDEADQVALARRKSMQNAENLLNLLRR